MATSGSYDFSVTASQVINGAFEDLGVIAPGGTPAAADTAIALNRLNLIAKQWQGSSDMAAGMKIWTRKRIMLFLQEGQHIYTLGSGGSKAAQLETVGRTTISADEALGQTTISITSNTDSTSWPGTTITMASTNIVGIEQDDGTIHWTTISGTPAATMTISVALTAAASAGNYVWWYATTGAVARPIKLESAVLRNANLTDSPLRIYTSAEEYDQGVSDKFGDGNPTSLLFEPGTLLTQIFLDSQPTDVTEHIVMTVLFPQEDYDAEANDIAFPQEFYNALMLELAYRLAPAYHAEWTKVQENARVTAIMQAKQTNPEQSSHFFQPGID
jgi:hypothetical protein